MKTRQKKISVLVVAVATILTITLLSSNVAATSPYYVNKAILAPGVDWTDSDIHWVADTFDLIDMDFNGSRTNFYINYTYAAGNMRGNNTDMVILGYKDLVYVHSYDNGFADLDPAWFMRDDSDQVLYNSYWGVYLMDINNATYQQFWIDDVNAKLADGTGTEYSGVFIDDCWDEISYYASSVNASIPAAIQADWHANVTDFLTHIKLDCSGDVYINSDEWATDDYITEVDGQCLEGFVHCEWDAWNYYDGHINLGDDLARKSALPGVSVICASGSLNTGTSQMLQVLTYCWDNFVGNSTDFTGDYFSFNSWYHADGQHGYYPYMDTVVIPYLPTATPSPIYTATPTPAPTDESLYLMAVNYGIGGIIILAPAVILWAIMGGYGFFLGVNIGIILGIVVYSSYVPLWLIIPLGALDILFLTGKARSPEI